jgi:hypothetical protein
MVVFAAATLWMGGVRADLLYRGGGAVYDTDLNITWLADANLAGNAMSFADAKAWAEGLVYRGQSDWRLPVAFGPAAACTSRYDCAFAGEMNHLYYTELSGLAGSSGPGFDADRTLFRNLQDWYWVDATVYAGAYAGAYHFGIGYYGDDLKTTLHHVWAVRTGDVEPVIDPPIMAIPEPSTLAVLLLGCLGIWLRNRGHHRLAQG